MKRHSYFWTLSLGVFVLIVWECGVRALGTSPLVLPAPTRVADVLWKTLTNGYLWPHIWQTLVEVFWGIVLGGFMGCVGGIVLGESRHLRLLLMPYIVLSQVVPKLALAPLFIVWFGFGVLPTIVITALICFFPLLENTVTSMQQVDAQKLELFKMLRASPWQTLWHLKIPSSLPSIMAGFRVAVVLAWVGAVVGEFIGSAKGLGALIIAAQGSMDTPLMFAVLVVITVLGITSYGMVQLIERRFLSFS
jgi:NitT/TauT family transport system permease protein